MSFYVFFGLVALGLAIGTYAASVTAARIWSRHIAVAIDNYRHCLIQQLGCSSLGRKWTVPEEQEVWQELTYWLKWRRLPAVHFTPPAPAKADKAKPEEAD